MQVQYMINIFNIMVIAEEDIDQKYYKKKIEKKYDDIIYDEYNKKNLDT